MAGHARFTLLHQMMDAQGAAHGAKAALRFAGREISYAELAANGRKLANALAAAGVGHGDRIACLARNSAEYHEILIGAATLGAVLVPLNWRLTASELRWILNDCGAVMLFAGADFADMVSIMAADCAALRQVITMDDAYPLWRDAQTDTPTAAAVAPDDVAVQLYTSGTTGRPKGAMLSHRALLAFRSLPPEQQPEWNRWSDDDVSLIVMPQFHIGGTGFGLQTLCAGATGLVMTEFDAGQVLEAIERDNLSKIFTVPSAIRLLLDHPRARAVDYRRIRTMVYGASPIPLELLREAMMVFQCGFVQQYGMTEACGTICVLPPDDHHVEGTPRMRSAGKALPDVEIAILGPDRSPLPAGAIGEIAVRSPTLMQGYWNLPDATAEALTPDGWFLTGDAGDLDADGYLYIRDRIKDMIVSGGENVYPAEVEAVLLRHPDVQDVAVIGVPDARWGEAVKAVMVAKDRDAAAIIAWARGELAGFKLPKSIDFVDALPRNASGKILRRELRAPYWQGRERNIN